MESIVEDLKQQQVYLQDFQIKLKGYLYKQRLFLEKGTGSSFDLGFDFHEILRSFEVYHDDAKQLSMEIIAALILKEDEETTK